MTLRGDIGGNKRILKIFTGKFNCVSTVSDVRHRVMLLLMSGFCLAASNVDYIMW